jgi:hypothetical protein
MPDTPVEPSGGGRYSPDMETRVAILEHMAQATLATLERIERKFETMDRRFEMADRRFEAMEGRIDAMNLQHRADFRWLLGSRSVAGGACSARSAAFSES